MGTDTSTIRKEVEETRERMGETVEALAGKADVKGRVRGSVSDKVDSVREAVTGVAASANDVTPDTGDVRDGARRAKGLAQENPLGLAVGAVAVGFLGGLLLPATRPERQHLAPLGDDLRDKAQTVVDHGRDAAQEIAQTAGAAAKDAAGDVAETARGAAGEAAEAAKDTAREHGDGLKDDLGTGGNGSGDPSRAAL